MKMILVELEELAAMLRQAVREEIAQSNVRKNPDDQSEFISLKEAQRILPFSSKSKWQELRDSGEILITKLSPRKILYQRKSLQEYARKKQLNTF